MNNSKKTNNKIGTCKWNIGAHTTFSSIQGVSDTLKNSIRNGMNVTQFFLGSPKSFNRHKITKEDYINSNIILDRYPTHIFSHFPYVANLSGSVKQLAWVGDKEQDGKTQSILNELEYELKAMSLFNAISSGVVIHPGNYKDRIDGIKAISKSINKINFSKGSKLLLENAAGKGCSLATTFQEIKDIIDNVDDNKKKHIGVCVDTAHLCGWGEYDLSKSSEVLRMFEEFDKTIGIDKFKLLHLNDSVVPLGSKKDHHALLGTGCIWNESHESLITLLNECNKYNIPILLETDTVDVRFLASLCYLNK
jgi:deoxyribonuclease-4